MPARPPVSSPILVHDGRYEIHGKIGVGGYKTVWSAKDRRTHQLVALSVLHDLSDDDEAPARFEQEAHILAHLTKDLPSRLTPFTRNVVTLIDSGTLHDGGMFKGPFITTQLVTGQPLDEFIRPHVGGLPWTQAARIIIDVLEALEVCHTPTPHRGPVIHRDIKPPNIIVTPKGDAVVLDFGVSKMVVDQTAPEQSAIMGTVRYMAPEQLQIGASVGPQTDLYAVGVILHELVTGTPPWNIKTFRQTMDLLDKRSRGTEPQLEKLHSRRLPFSLTELVEKLLSVEPTDRPKTAEQVREKLKHLLSSAPTMPLPRQDSEATLDMPTVRTIPQTYLPPSDDPPTVKNHPRRFTFNRPMMFILLVAVVGVALALGMMWFERNQTSPNSDATASEPPAMKPASKKSNAMKPEPW